MKDENKLDEMVDIMSHLHQYVHAQEFTEDVSLPNTGETVPVQKAVIHSILFGGDQLTAARARGAKRIKTNGITPQARFDGIIPCAEDWHTKVNFLEVIWKYFNSQSLQLSMVYCTNYATSPVDRTLYEIPVQTLTPVMTFLCLLLPAT